MKTWTRCLAIAVGGAALVMTTAGNSGADGPDHTDQSPLKYPHAHKGEVVDDYHGTRVPDPYRWLEEIDSAETRKWVEAENHVTNSYLDGIPQRSKIKERLTRLWDYEKYGIPDKEGGRYFYTYNTGLQNQSVLFTTKSLGGDAKKLLDPNTLSKDGTVALGGLSITDDGSKMAYALADAGSDWITWKVRDVETGDDTGDDDPLEQVLRRRVDPRRPGLLLRPVPRAEGRRGPQGRQLLPEDVLTTRSARPSPTTSSIWKDADHKDWDADPTVTDDGKYLILTLGKGTDDKYRVLYRPLDQPDAEPVHLVGNFDADYTFIDNDGPDLLVQDRQGRPARQGRRHRHPPARRSTLERPDPPGRRDPSERPPTSAAILIANYLKDAHSQVKVFYRLRPVRPRSRPARPRHRRRLRRRPRRHRNLLRLHLVHHAPHHLPLRRRQPAKAPSSGSPRSSSTPTTTRPRRSSTPARTAPGCRCS